MSLIVLIRDRRDSVRRVIKYIAGHIGNLKPFHDQFLFETSHFSRFCLVFLDFLGLLGTLGLLFADRPSSVELASPKNLVLSGRATAWCKSVSLAQKRERTKLPESRVIVISLIFNKPFN